MLYFEESLFSQRLRFQLRKKERKEKPNKPTKKKQQKINKQKHTYKTGKLGNKMKIYPPPKKQ
jgi:hypothetical protein